MNVNRQHKFIEQLWQMEEKQLSKFSMMVSKRSYQRFISNLASMYLQHSWCLLHFCIGGQDLKNAKSLVEWIAWAEPRYDFNPMIDEQCKEAPKEIDFNHEAGNSPCSVSHSYASLDNSMFQLSKIDYALPAQIIIVAFLLNRQSEPNLII